MFKEKNEYKDEKNESSVSKSVSIGCDISLWNGTHIFQSVKDWRMEKKEFVMLQRRNNSDKVFISWNSLFSYDVALHKMCEQELLLFSVFLAQHVSLLFS